MSHRSPWQQYHVGGLAHVWHCQVTCDHGHSIDRQSVCVCVCVCEDKQHNLSRLTYVIRYHTPLLTRPYLLLQVFNLALQRSNIRLLFVSNAFQITTLAFECMNLREHPKQNKKKLSTPNDAKQIILSCRTGEHVIWNHVSQSPPTQYTSLSLIPSCPWHPSSLSIYESAIAFAWWRPPSNEAHSHTVGSRTQAQWHAAPVHRKSTAASSKWAQNTIKRKKRQHTYNIHIYIYRRLSLIHIWRCRRELRV